MEYSINESNLDLNKSGTLVSLRKKSISMLTNRI